MSRRYSRGVGRWATIEGTRDADPANADSGAVRRDVAWCDPDREGVGAAHMIRSELDVLLDKVQDPALRADLRSQIDRLKQRRSFGLVFEQHIPERVRLPQHPIRVGST